MSLFKERSVNAKKLIQLQNKINSLTQELISVKNNNPGSSKEVAQLQTKLDSMAVIVEELQLKNGQLEKALQESSDSCKQLKTENRGLKTSLTRLKKKLSSEEN